MLQTVKGGEVVRERPDDTDSARVKGVGGERRGVTGSGRGKGYGGERRQVTDSARGRGLFGRDMILQTVQGERGRWGET